jgi:ubiquinone biosynthesis protein COQ9
MGSIERSAERDQAVEATLPHVPLDGWTTKALRAGLADSGHDPADLALLFPGGPIEAIEVWGDLADRRMAEALGALDLGAMRVRERVVAAIRIRLEQNAGHREAAARATALLALPRNAPTAARMTARTVDTIWTAIGDRSTDFSWYTKRASLAAIYGATMLYWLSDDSEGAEATLRFLDRRIDALMIIPRVQRRLGAIAERLPDPFRLLARLRRA